MCVFVCESSSWSSPVHMCPVVCSSFRERVDHSGPDVLQLSGRKRESEREIVEVTFFPRFVNVAGAHGGMICVIAAGDGSASVLLYLKVSPISLFSLRRDTCVPSSPCRES